MLMFWNDLFEVDIYYCVAMNIKPTMRYWLDYYEFGLLMKGSMRILKDLLLYFILGVSKKTGKPIKPRKPEKK
jgi:hypothetical protein